MRAVKYTVSLVLSLAVWLPAVAPAGDVGSAVRFGRNDLLVSGTDAMHRGEFEEGIGLILRGLDRDMPDRERAAALSNLCAGYNVTGDYDKALVHCDRSLVLDRGNWRAHHNRAFALLAQNRIDEAIASASEGLKLAPDSQLLNDLIAKARRRRANPHVIIETFP